MSNIKVRINTIPITHIILLDIIVLLLFMLKYIFLLSFKFDLLIKDSEEGRKNKNIESTFAKIENVINLKKIIQNSIYLCYFSGS